MEEQASRSCLYRTQQRPQQDPPHIIQMIVVGVSVTQSSVAMQGAQKVMK